MQGQVPACGCSSVGCRASSAARRKCMIVSVSRMSGRLAYGHRTSRVKLCIDHMRATRVIVSQVSFRFRWEKLLCLFLQIQTSDAMGPGRYCPPPQPCRRPSCSDALLMALQIHVRCSRGHERIKHLGEQNNPCRLDGERTRGEACRMLMSSLLGYARP